MVNWKILIIVLLAAAFRLLWLDLVPAGLDWDEAAIGWNAKTIWQLRVDEFGTRLPLSFKSFGDYKPPLYIYLTAPLVGLLGANEISVRLLSALSGVASVYFLYLIGWQLINARVGLMASLLLAVSPWHVLVSRPAFEPSLALALILAGIWMYLKALSRPWLVIIAAIFFTLSLYSYQSPKVFVPIFILGIVLIYRRVWMSKKHWLHLAVSGLLAVILLMPLVKDWQAGGGNRFQATTIFFQKDVAIFPALIKNYLANFEFNYLFLGGEIVPRMQMKQVGMLLLVELPLLVLGVIKLWNNRSLSWAKFLLWWLVIGPLPAMIGFEVPHPIRSLQWLPVLILVAALGMEKVIISKRYGWLIATALAINSIFFAYHYFVSYRVASAPDWQYGYKEAAQIAKDYQSNVDKIIVSSYYGQPYVFIYWYQDWRPQSIFWGGAIKYLFREIKLEQDLGTPNILFIGAPEEIPPETKGIIKEIYFPDGQVAFRVVKT